MRSDLKSIFNDYITCLNAQDWANLGKFVADYVTHNQSPLGLSGYRKMLEGDYAAIPDLQFNPELVICEGQYIFSRLRFDCAPTGEFLDLPVNGKRVLFYEHAVYQFQDDKIVRVRSIIDKAAIETQL